MPSPPWMIYGANGYTGVLVAEEAVRRGHRPLLAGRSAGRLAPLAERLGLDYVAFSLDDEAVIARRLADVALVFHAAGPFTLTSAPMVRACLLCGVHYVDITGEINVFEHTFAHDEAARKRGILLISGLGFDVIASDCLAAHVAARAPDAVDLRIGISAIGRASVGTTRSLLEILARGGWVRRNGVLRPVLIGWDVRKVRFPHGERTALAIPWGDLSTAYRTTGIPNITTYFAYPPELIRLARVMALPGQAALSIRPVRRLFQRLVGWTVRNPEAAFRQRARSYLWARAADPEGRAAEAWLETVEAYTFTALAGVRAVERLLSASPVGALSPAQALGADFVLDIEGSRRHDSLPE